jgi:uncharacterized protein YbjQ (UPF0145 family)
MIITTTPTIEGKAIVEYKGIVTGEAIMGANIVRDIFASITDIVGGRSSAYETKLSQVRGVSLAEMEQNAVALGANALSG